MKILFVHDVAFCSLDVLAPLRHRGNEAKIIEAKSLFELKLAIKQNPADVYHVNYLRSPLYAAFLSGARPLVLHAHGDDVRYGLNIFQKIAIKRGSRILCSTSDLIPRITGSQLIPRPVDTQLYHAREIKKGRAVYFLRTTSDPRARGNEHHYISVLRQVSQSLGLSLDIVPSMTAIVRRDLPEFLANYEVFFDREIPSSEYSKLAIESSFLGLRVFKGNEEIRINSNQHDNYNVADQLLKIYNEILEQ